MSKLTDDLNTGDFVENNVRIKYSVERFEDYYLLTELLADGIENSKTKKKKIMIYSMEGLLKNKHFSKAKHGRRISHGEVESRLEFYRNVPK
jgi:hypothetical protein